MGDLAWSEASLVVNFAMAHPRGRSMEGMAFHILLTPVPINDAPSLTPSKYLILISAIGVELCHRSSVLGPS